MNFNVKCDDCNYETASQIEIIAHTHEDKILDGISLNHWTIEKFPNIETDRFRNTPLTNLKELGQNVFLKDESYNPTKSFKDRGIELLVEDAVEKGVKEIAIPSTGNAAISLVHYSLKNNIEPLVFVPKNSANSKKQILSDFIIEDENLIESFIHFSKYVKENKDVYNGFPVLNVAYTFGLMHMAYEIVSQLEKAPDAIILPCGSGSNAVAQYYAFNTLKLKGEAYTIPQIIPVQIEGADPITQGYSQRQFDTLLMLDQPVDSLAKAIASDTSYNYFKLMQILRETNSTPISVTDKEILAQSEMEKFEISSRSVLPAYQKAVKKNIISEEATVVLIGTAGRRK